MPDTLVEYKYSLHLLSRTINSLSLITAATHNGNLVTLFILVHFDFFFREMKPTKDDHGSSFSQAQNNANYEELKISKFPLPSVQCLGWTWFIQLFIVQESWKQWDWFDFHPVYKAVYLSSNSLCEEGNITTARDEQGRVPYPLLCIESFLYL